MDDLQIIEYPDNELELISKWRGDSRVNRYIRQGIRTLDEVHKWKRDYFSSERNQLFSIRINDTPIGYFTVENIAYTNRNCEFGIVIGETYMQEKGIGTESIKLMLHRAFGKMNMYRVLAVINEGNTASVRCFEKAGFALEGRHRHARLVGGKFKDVLFYSILSDEWPQ